MGDRLFLPIGSIVLLKGGTKKVMITGFCSIPNNNKNKLYDYSGCMYPEGFINTNEVCLFNNSQIDKVYFIGYTDKEEKEFQVKLKDLVQSLHLKATQDSGPNTGDSQYSVDRGAF